MAHALELVHGGHGQIVAVVAEAGTGKSRLFYEFKTMLPADCKVLEAYSVSHCYTTISAFGRPMIRPRGATSFEPRLPRWTRHFRTRNPTCSACSPLRKVLTCSPRWTHR